MLPSACDTTQITLQSAQMPCSVNAEWDVVHCINCHSFCVKYATLLSCESQMLRSFCNYMGMCLNKMFACMSFPTKSPMNHISLSTAITVNGLLLNSTSYHNIESDGHTFKTQVLHTSVDMHHPISFLHSCCSIN